jgi:hypothetical protein
MVQLDFSILQLEALSLVETDLRLSPSPYAAKTKDIHARGWLNVLPKEEAGDDG